jgi:hypothetical protein
MMTVLASNAELYRYLATLEAELRAHGPPDVVVALFHAARCAPGPRREFLLESRVALRAVLWRARGMLTEGRRDELIEVLRQLDAALANRP